MADAIERLKAMDKPMLAPAEVAPVLGCSPYTINLQAQRDPGMLGFPVVVMGRRVRIPRLAFIRWYYGGTEAGGDA